MSNLVNLYRDYFGLVNAHFSYVDHNDSMIAIVYKVDTPSNKSLILKICPRDEDFHREVHFLNALKGFLPVPKIHQVAKPIAGQSGAVLMEYLEGSLLKESDWTHNLAYSIGSKLALLHSKRADACGDFAQKQLPISGIQEYFKDKFFEELNECINHLPKETTQRCKDYYESHKNLLNSVDGPCMVHRDFRPGNIIVQDGKLVGIIDWASARFGFAEQDFCSMKHRNWPRNPEDKQSFLAGYSSIRQVPNCDPIMPLLQLGRALAVIGFTVKSDTWKEKNQKIYQYSRHFLDNFIFKNNL